MSVILLEQDIRDAVATLAPASFDCLIVDPPYGQTACRWDKRVKGWPSLLRPLLKPSGSMWVFGTLRSFMAEAGEYPGWRLAQDIIWEKHNGSGFDTQRFRRVHEQAAMFYLADAPWAGVYRQPQFTHDAKARSVRAKSDRIAHLGRTGPHVYQSIEGGPRQMRSVLQVRSCHRQSHGHPTQKPEAIYEPLLRYSCPPGGLVLDPFAGSGTTGAVCASLGLSAGVIEKEAPFAAVIRERLGLQERAAA